MTSVRVCVAINKQKKSKKMCSIIIFCEAENFYHPQWILLATMYLPRSTKHQQQQDHPHQIIILLFLLYFNSDDLLALAASSSASIFICLFSFFLLLLCATTTYTPILHHTIRKPAPTMFAAVRQPNSQATTKARWDSHLPFVIL